MLWCKKSLQPSWKIWRKNRSSTWDCWTWHGSRVVTSAVVMTMLGCQSFGGMKPCCDAKNRSSQAERFEERVEVPHQFFLYLFPLIFRGWKCQDGLSSPGQEWSLFAIVSRLSSLGIKFSKAPRFLPKELRKPTDLKNQEISSSQNYQRILTDVSEFVSKAVSSSFYIHFFTK